MKRAALPLLTLLVMAAPVGAQTPPDTVIPLPGVEVSVTRGARPAERVPLALTVVDKQAIQRARPGISPDEALAGVPGLLIANRHNFSLGPRLSIRGFGARAAFGVRGVRVLVDGIPLTMADGQANLNNLDLGTAGRIEVIRGAASALYGNAAGGVVAVETENPPDAALAGEAELVVGDYGSGSADNLRRMQLKTGGRFARGDWLASVSRLDLDGYRAHSSAQTTHFNGRVRRLLNDDGTTRLAFVLNAADAPVAQNPGSLPLDSARLRPRNAWPANVRTRSGEATRQVQAGATLSRQTEDVRWDASLYGLVRDVENPLPFAWIDLERRAGGARFSMRRGLEMAGRETFWTIGGDVEAQRDLRREFANDGGAPGDDPRKDQVDGVRSVGPFVQAELPLSRQVELLAGLRFDAVRFRTDDRLLADGDASGGRTLHAWSPMVGVAVLPRAGWTLWANVTTAFQTPTTTELINAPPAPGEPCCPGGFNATLEPQRARGAEVGSRLRVGRATAFELVGYTLRVRDELVPYQVPEAPGREFFRNLGRSRHTGIEASVHVALTAALAASLAWTWSDFVVAEDGSGRGHEGNRLPGVPEHQLRGLLALRGPARTFGELEARHLGRMFVDDANSAATPAATIVDLRLGRDAGGVRPFVGITNVFDRAWYSSVVINANGGRFYEPAPGRAYYVGLSAPFTLRR